MTTIGNHVAFLRKQKGLTQEALSEQAGINLRTLQRIETGETEPRGSTLHLLCQALQVPIEELADYGKTEDRSQLIYLHLSVLSGIFIPMGQILLPLILWITQKNKIKDFYTQGANIINFQLWCTILLFGFMVLSLVLTMPELLINVKLGFGILTCWCVVCVIWPIINAIRIRSGARIKPFYPWIIRLIK